MKGEYIVKDEHSWNLMVRNIALKQSLQRLIWGNGVFTIENAVSLE